MRPATRLLLIVVVSSVAACGGTTTASPSAPSSVGGGVPVSSAAPGVTVSSPDASPSGPPLAELPSLTIQATIPGFYGPLDLLATKDAVWVLEHEVAALDRIDPKTNKVSATVELGSGSTDFANGLGLAGGRLWSFNRPAGEVVGVDPATAKVVAKVKLGENGDQFAVGDDAAWLVTGGNLARIDPGTGTVTAHPLDGSCPSDGLAVGGGFIWIAAATGSLCKIDERTGAVVARATGTGNGSGIAIVDGRPWLAAADGGLSIVDPATLTVMATVPAPPQGSYQGTTLSIGLPGGEATVVVGDPDGKGGWLRYIGDTVGRVALGDAPSVRLLAGFPHQSLAGGVTSAFGSLWVANYGDGTVTRYALPTP